MAFIEARYRARTARSAMGQRRKLVLGAAE
jgi:hypothetical protein